MSESAEYADPNDFIPEQGPALYGLISLIPKARGIPRDELGEVKIDTWDDEDSTWKVALNGSGEMHVVPISPIGDEYPNPSAIEFYAGTFLLTVDSKALVLCHPDHLEWFTNEGNYEETERWEVAALHAVRDHVADLGLEGKTVPPVEEFVTPEQRDGVWGAEQ